MLAAGLRLALYLEVHHAGGFHQQSEWACIHSDLIVGPGLLFAVFGPRSQGKDLPRRLLAMSDICQDLPFVAPQRMTENNEIEVHCLELRLCLRLPSLSSVMKIGAHH